jgi:uncharacterized protein YecE (DUF72 family)
MRLYIGCPLWGYKEWVGNFFPAHSRASDFLHLYSQRMTTVEGNTTFYSTPSSETIARWRQETPPHFQICPKISRAISHEMNLAASKQQTYAFVARMQELGTRLGPIFLQLPPTFSPLQMDQLRAFLDFWPAGLRLAVEVRHADFFKEEHEKTLNELLNQHQVARVLMDTRPIRIGTTQEKQVLQAREHKPDLPLHIVKTTDFVFVRYIGHPRMEVNASFLDQWATKLAEWYNDGLTLYVFCHCPFEVHSPSICRELHRRIAALAPVPPLPWQEDEHSSSQPEQERLF